MVRGRHGELGVEEGEEGIPEVGGEAWVSVRNNYLGKAVEREDSVKEKLGQVGSIDIGGSREEVGPLGEFVHDSEYSIITPGCLGELGDEIHSDGVPTVRRNLQGLE